MIARLTEQAIIPYVSTVWFPGYRRRRGVDYANLTC